jgi:outer membrane protein assembly factor BamB
MRENDFARMLGIVALCLFGGTEALAQRPGTTDNGGTPPAWMARLPGVVMWHRPAPAERLLVGTNTALYGVDAASGRIAWQRPHQRPVTSEQCPGIADTPFVVIPAAGRGAKTIVLDVRDGRVLLDSSAGGPERVLDAFVLPRRGGLILLGERPRGAGAVISLLEPAAGKALWTTGLAVSAGRKRARPAAAGVQPAGAPGFAPDALELEDGILVASQEGLHRVQRQDGRVAWSVAHADRPGRVRLSVAPNHPALVFVASEILEGRERGATRFMAHKRADGSPAWKEPLHLRGSAGTPIAFEKGLLLSAHLQDKGRLEFVDPATGASLWGTKGKGMEIPGGIVDHHLLGDAVVVAMGVDSAWTNKGMVYFLNVLDPRSRGFRFRSAHKVRGRLLQTEVVPRGLLYVTTSELNILDPQTGRPLLENPVRSDGTLVTAARDRLLYAFSQEDGALYALDTQAGTLRTLSRDRVTLADRDEPVALEIGADRVTLISSQNVVAFGLDGAVKFHAHHPAPKFGGFIRGLLAAKAVHATASSTLAATRGISLAGAAAQMPAGSFGRMATSAVALNQVATASDQASVARGSVQALQTRFKATAAAEDVVFMMVRFESGNVGLARVSKATGQVLGHVDLGWDRQPDYQVDGPARRLYYRVGNNEILGYSF